MSWSYKSAADAFATPEQRADLIARLKRLPSLLTETVAQLDNAQLDTPYGEGEWTVRQVVHHLADAHMQGFARVRWILTEDKPTLKPFDQDVWAEMFDASKSSIEPSLLILTGLHTRFVTLIENLSEDDWSRAANHPEEGELTAGMFIATYAAHGEVHLEQIVSLKERMGW